MEGVAGRMGGVRAGVMTLVDQGDSVVAVVAGCWLPALGQPNFREDPFTLFEPTVSSILFDFTGWCRMSNVSESKSKCHSHHAMSV
jgi:hypothetical protein